MANANGKIPATAEGIMKDETLSRDEKIEALKPLYFEARAVQRAATESPMGADDGLNDRLQELEKALDKLGADVTGPEDTKAATL